MPADFLLKNGDVYNQKENLLPLSLGKKQKIVLIGLDAVVPYTGGSGAGAVSNSSAVLPFTALKALGADVTYEEGPLASPAAAAKAAKAADVSIIFGSAHTGEGHDLLNLLLSANIDTVIPWCNPSGRIGAEGYHRRAFNPW